MTYLDWTGNTVNIGDVIVYPTRSSSSMWLNIAKVKEIKILKGGIIVVKAIKVQTRWLSDKPHFKKVTLFCVDRHIKVTNVCDPNLKQIMDYEI